MPKPLALSRSLVVVALGVVAASLICTPLAGAKGVVSTFGQHGTAAGEFAFPTGVAVNQATGDVYVADADCCSFITGGQRVTQFTADGTFVRAWGWGVATGAEQLEVCTTSCLRAIGGSGDGQLSLSFDSVPPQVAVDQADGSVYVVDSLNDRVQKFSESGTFLGKLGTTGSGDGQLSAPSGVAVDPLSGDVYVGDTGNSRVLRFDSAGAYEAQIGAPGGGSGDGDFLAPTHLAFDSTGRLYVVDSGNGRVQRFNAAGAFDQVVAPGAVNSPTTIAVDPADDHVYVAGQNADFTSRAIFELDAAGGSVDTHAVDIGLSTFPAGLAVRSSTGRLYGSSISNPSAMLILDDVTPPTVSIDPVSDITPTSAAFSGTVNPQGPPDVSYRFEYSTGGDDWTSTPDVDVGAGTADVPVSQTVTGLDPNTDYMVRLVAAHDFNAGTTTSSEVPFTTVPGLPLVRALGAGNPTDSAAWLGGEVNPRNSQTSYYVEYALASDTGYADSSRVPATPDEVDVGDGNEYVAVSQLATGLQPDTDYRFRVVATNAAGTAEGPSRTFTTRSSLPVPPPGRGYEMVSPLDKNGAKIGTDVSGVQYSTFGASTTGDAVAYAAFGQFAGASGAPPQSQYRSVRGASGWSTRGVSPPMEQFIPAESSSVSIWSLSEDLTQTVVATNASLAQGSSLLGGSFGLYLQDNSVAPSTYQLLSRPAGPLPADQNPEQISSRFTFAGASGDMRHIVFNSLGRQLTPEGPEDGDGVYHWFDGQLRFVSELPAGDPSQGSVAGSPVNVNDRTKYFGEHVVSEDGERVFFISDTTARHLYVREGGAVTRPVSASERAGDASVLRRGEFWAAEAGSGGQALFTSPAPLTEEATASGGTCTAGNSFGDCHWDLYLWDAASPAGSQLMDLTTADPEGGGVMAVVGAADDLSRAYFVAGGALAPGATAGRPNLYAWSPGGGVRHIAVLDGQDEPIWSRDRRLNDVVASDDGRWLLFASRANVTATDTANHLQIYLYDALADRLDCVSCDDGPVTGDAWLFNRPNASLLGAYMPYRGRPRNLSSNGRAFFETAERLARDDTNGKVDVYMWSDGELSLISSGRGGYDSDFVDASESGDNVFFMTRDRLVGSDVDDLVDVYDARVGGGFPEQRLPAECVGDGCQGAPSGAPNTTKPASLGLRGRGDVASGPRPSFSLLGGVSRNQRVRLARGERVVLRLRVSRAGRVWIVARARIGGASRVVAAGSRRAPRAGTVRVGLRLSSRARRRIAVGGALRVSLSVRFAGVERPRTLRLSLGGAR